MSVNKHASAYGFKGLVMSKEGNWTCQDLNMRRNLEDNGIPDQAATFEGLNLPQETYIPVILTYWMDDLTQM